MLGCAASSARRAASAAPRRRPRRVLRPRGGARKAAAPRSAPRALGAKVLRPETRRGLRAARERRTQGDPHPPAREGWELSPGPRLKIREHWAGQRTIHPVNCAAMSEALPPGRKDAQICRPSPLRACFCHAQPPPKRILPWRLQNLSPCPMHLFPYEHKSGVLVLSPGHNS